MTADTPIAHLTRAAAEAGQATQRSRLPGAVNARVADAVEDFEAVFLSQMLTPVFDSLGSDHLFGGGPAERTYRSLLVQEYGKVLSKAGGIGIADEVRREVLKLQEVDS